MTFYLSGSRVDLSSSRISTEDPKTKIELLQGTLDMLILRTLLFGPAHGHAIAHAIEHGSEDVLQVDHGSLYPAWSSKA